MTAKVIFIKDTGNEESKALESFQDKFEAALTSANLSDVQTVRVADIGVYNKGITIKVLPQGTIYTNLQEGDIKNIIDKSVRQNAVINELKLKDEGKQQRIVLRNAGLIDPESIEEYIYSDGYQGLKKAIDMGPDATIEEMKKSGLRGRGGAGFPTWMKWKFTRDAEGDEKYVICNADEGDPGAYMDRSVLEGDPHSVLEGMAIAGLAMGSSKGYCYIRAEYPLAIERIQKAIDQAKRYGLLGENILGSDFTFEIEIRLGAGAFVCGEETALIASIEGKRGYPRPRPPFPAQKGLWGKPTCINNVETLANVPYILTHGGATFASVGTEESKGTKVFALTGKVKNSGLVEVPMGTTLRDIVEDIGGGSLDGKTLKAVQTGGPSGGVIPINHLDTPVSYEHLQKLGSIMGSGGMIVMDEDDCIVDISKFYLGFCVDESCGKCAPCRIGGRQMLTILDNITEGKGELKDLARLKLIAEAMKKASLCGLGQTAANPVLSTLNFFEDEYKDHIVNDNCSAASCQALTKFKIIDGTCKKCGLCVKVCPVDAISGNRESGYKIDANTCIKCGRCIEACKFGAITRG